MHANVSSRRVRRPDWFGRLIIAPVTVIVLLFAAAAICAGIADVEGSFAPLLAGIVLGMPFLVFYYKRQLLDPLPHAKPFAWPATRHSPVSRLAQRLRPRPRPVRVILWPSGRELAVSASAPTRKEAAVGSGAKPKSADAVEYDWFRD